MQLWPKKLTLPNCRCIIGTWQISCRYAYVFRKFNSFNPIYHNLSFCEPKSSSPFVKCVFVKINLHIYMKFAKFLWYTYNSVAPLSWAKVDPKVKIVKKFLTFPNKADNFTNKVKFLTPINIYVESLLVKENFHGYSKFFPPLLEILQ